MDRKWNGKLPTFAIHFAQGIHERNLEKENLELHRHHWIALLLLFAVCFDIALDCHADMVTSQSLIITFIGILASIVVVGQLAQVHAIKSETDKNMEALKKEQIEIVRVQKELKEGQKELKHEQEETTENLRQVIEQLIELNTNHNFPKTNDKKGETDGK